MNVVRPFELWVPGLTFLKSQLKINAKPKPKLVSGEKYNIGASLVLNKWVESGTNKYARKPCLVPVVS